MSLTVRANPGADGRGPSLALSPRRGGVTGVAWALWRGEMPTPAESGDDGPLDARVGWGVAWTDAGGV